MTPVRVERMDDWKDATEWHFGSFCRDGKWTPDELREDVKQGSRQLWIAFDGEVKAAVLTMVLTDRQRTCVITHAAGSDRGSWTHLMEHLENEARAIGCQRMEAVARPGWERVLGWKKTHVVLEKEL